ncbi:MAG: zinc metallopeptidase [Kiritimatiellae bacterium]|nr:zinc metallopeptidase [Kiritimatiellia bacterium]
MFDPLYLAMLLPAMVLAGIASFWTRSTFGKYARRAASSGLTGAQAAEYLLQSQGVDDVAIKPARGFLSDHYDPTSRTLRLSPAVYQSRSLSAIGVACHEAGHALQHARRYLPLGLRTAFVPAAQIGSSGSYIIFILGFLLRSVAMMKLGVLLFALVVVFSLITLPVEWNATARAKRLMVQAGIVTPAEQREAGAVLNAAFLTYVASAFTAIMTLLYYMLRAGLLGGGRDD